MELGKYSLMLSIRVELRSIREHASFIEIGKLKAEWAQNIGIHMDLKSNESPSFNDFIHEIERRLVS